MELLNHQLKESKDELKEANLHTQEQKETAAIFKQKCTAAIEKARRVQEHVERLEEELQYSQEKVNNGRYSLYIRTYVLSNMSLILSLTTCFNGS